MGGCTYSFSQNYSLSGKVLDDKSQALESATVVVITAVDSIYKAFALSNGEGKFMIESLEKGEYVLQVSYLGYEQLNQSISIEADKELEPLVLKTDSELIENIEVVGENIPVTVKKDTIVYNADAFETQPNDVVEDLLRQMPGVEVESDGTIVAQGEEVEKVTVDGKEFFGNDPKIATKNLPAKAIDKVEFFDKKSDTSEFTGLDDGERTKTMNLELKEDYKSGYFGNVTGGYGTDQRYQGKAALNRFDKKLQLGILGNINNVNEQGFSFREYASFSGSFRGGGNNVNNGRSTGFVDTRSLGINSNYEFKPKTKLNVNYFLNDVDKTLDQLTTRDYIFDRAETFITNDSVNLFTGNQNHRLRIRFESQIDSTQDIKLSTNLEFTNADQQNIENSNTILSDGFLSNQQLRDGDEEASTREIEGQVTYRKKFGSIKKRIVTLDGTLNTGLDDFEGFTDSENTFFEPNTVSLITFLAQQQLQTNDQLDYTAKASFVEPLGGDKYLEFNYRRSNFHTELDRDVFDLESGTATLNDLLSNEYIRDFTFDRAGVGYYANTESTSLVLEGNMQYSRLNGDFSDNREDINRDNIAFLPRLSIRHELGQSHNVRLRYSTSVNLPSITQLQPFVDNTDPINIYVGNPDLDAEYSHRFRANYINFDQFNLTSLFAFLNVNYTRNKLVNRTIIDENFVKTTTPVNVSDDLTMTARISRGFPVRKLGMKVRINTNLRYSNSIVFVNEQKNDANTFGGGVGFTIENRSKDKVNISYTPRFNYSVSTYSESEENNLSFYDHSHEMEFDLYAIDKWSFGTSLLVNYYSAQNFGEAQVIPIWSADLSRRFMDNDRAEIKLAIFDILNENQGVSRTTNLNYIQNQVVNSLARYAMLSLRYNLQSGGGNAQSGRGGPPGRGRF